MNVPVTDRPEEDIADPRTGIIVSCECWKWDPGAERASGVLRQWPTFLAPHLIKLYICQSVLTHKNITKIKETQNFLIIVSTNSRFCVTKDNKETLLNAKVVQMRYEPVTGLLPTTKLTLSYGDVSSLSPQRDPRRYPENPHYLYCFNVTFIYNYLLSKLSKKFSIPPWRYSS